MKDQAAEATIAAVANKVSFGGGTVALFGGLAASDIAAISGAVVAIAGVIIQWYFRRRADRREAELLREQIRALRGE